MSKAYRLCKAPSVNIFIGKNRKLFLTHRDQLYDASPVFKAAFEGRFRESSEQKMDLPEEDEDTFKSFVRWLSHQRYEIPPEPKKPRLQVRDPEAREVVRARPQIRHRRPQDHPHDENLQRWGKRDVIVHDGSRIQPPLFRIQAFRRRLADGYVCEAPPSWFNGQAARVCVCGFEKQLEGAGEVIARFCHDGRVEGDPGRSVGR